MAQGVAQQDQNQSQGHIREPWGQMPIEPECVSVSAFPLKAHLYPAASQVSVYGSRHQQSFTWFIWAQARHAHRGLVDVCV